MRYQCNRCKKYFYVKRDYTSHLNRKYPCFPLDEVKKQKGNIERLTCIYCEKVFSCTKSLRRHYGTCKVKKKLDKEDKLQIENDQLKDKMDKLEDEVAQLKQLLINQQQINNQENRKVDIDGDHNQVDQSVTNQTINIHINAIGEENMDFLTDEAKLDIVKKMHKSIPALVEKVNFNEDHPENHNVYFPSVKNSYGSSFLKKKGWRTESIEDIVERLIDNGRIKVEELRNEVEDKLSVYNKNRLDELFDAVDGDTSAKSEKIMKVMKEKIKFTAIDNNYLIKETKKRWEKQNRKPIAI